MKQHLLPRADQLLLWYQDHGRSLPWRMRDGEAPDPYRTWLSEIMLQQTRVATVIPYFNKFVRRWPTVGDLASASREEILSAWAGLGYYARARNLHACAIKVSKTYGGVFPNTEVELSKLPGVGSYTAAAITAIAFGKFAAPVDGNIARIICRIFSIKKPVRSATVEIKNLTQNITPMDRAGAFTQALMDLGSIICTPQSPRCDLCPWKKCCSAAQAGDPAAFPRKVKKTSTPSKCGDCFWLQDASGRVVVRSRPNNGLLGGMTEFPSTPWQEKRLNFQEALAYAPSQGPWQRVNGVIRHTFSHFKLELRLYRSDTHIDQLKKGERWVSLTQLSNEPLPTLMKKIVNAIQT